MRVRYLGASEYERARVRERVAEAMLRSHVAEHYPSVRLDALRVDVLRGDAGSLVFHALATVGRDREPVELAGVIDDDGRCTRLVVR